MKGYWELSSEVLSHLRQWPVLAKSCYPRHIVTPTGYANPKWFGASLAAQILAGTQPQMDTDVHLTEQLTAQALLCHGVPTYFLAPHFVEAAYQTILPPDLPLSAIKWPLPAMVFVLPTEFINRHIGHFAPFLAVANVPAGTYPNPKAIPIIELELLQELRPIHNGRDRFCVYFPIFFEQESPFDYCGYYQFHHTIADIQSAPMNDVTTYEDQLFDARPKLTRCDLPPAEERIFNSKMNVLAVKLLLAIHARPELVEAGRLERPASNKKGKVKDALWSPNVIGRSYRLLHERGGQPGGASVRMHWRRGHYRHQRHGVGLAETKIIWIDPVLVHADSLEPTCA